MGKGSILYRWRAHAVLLLLLFTPPPLPNYSSTTSPGPILGIPILLLTSPKPLAWCLS